MTRKQIAFCRAFLDCYKGAEAARRAGYSKKTARQIAWKIIHKSRVDIKTLCHAYNVILDPEWPWDIDDNLLPSQAATAAHRAFLEKSQLPQWFIDDAKAAALTEKLGEQL